MLRTTRHIILVGLLLIGPGPLWSAKAQDASISGRVVDAETGAPLSGVNVFLDQMTRGAATEADGAFEIAPVAPGSYRVAASMVGYAMESVPLEVVPEQSTYEVEFELEPAVLEVDEVLVEGERPRRWEQNLERFKRAFLGNSRNADETTILNPYVLDFQVDDGVLTARAAAPLEVENRALGYRLTIALTRFRDSGEYVTMAGPLYFRKLEPESPAESSRWQRQRSETYRGSLMHLLRSLVAGTSRDEGYFVAHQLEQQTYGYGARRLVDLGVIPFIERTERPYLYRIFLENDLHVEFGRQTSRLHLNEGEAVLHQDGYMYTSGYDDPPITASGALAQRRVADMLPRDYGLEEEARP